MDSINFSNLQPFNQSNPGQNQQVYEISRLNLAAVSRQQSADITLVTKEGDKVTFSADSSIEAAYATYDNQAQLKGVYAESRGKLNSATIEREVSISVEGDLNDQEKKEIKKVLREIFKMMKSYLADPSGNQTVAAVKDIQLDTLANVEAKFEVKKTIVEINHMSAEYVTNSEFPAPETEDSEPVKRLINRMVGALKDSRLERYRFMKFFGNKPSRLTEKYFEHEPETRNMRKIVNKIFSGLFHQLENTTNKMGDRYYSNHPVNRDAILEPEAV